MRLYHLFIFLISGLLMGACKASKNMVAQDVKPVSVIYQKQLDKWRANRYDNLTSADGWLTLVGLYWLVEGENTLGSEKPDISFPESVPVSLGVITKTGMNLKYTNNSNKSVSVNDEMVDEAVLMTDATTSPTKMTYKDYSWYIIQRGERQGLRLRDTNHIARRQFTEIPYFPIRSEWKKVAAFSDPLENETIKIADITGKQTDTKVEGYLTFIHLEKEHKLLALDGGPKDLFLVFADETTDAETYGGGRFLYAKRPDINGRTYLDFNKAINPPCMFSDFATCPLPPRKNVLPFRVEAGELKMPGH